MCYTVKDSAKVLEKNFRCAIINRNKTRRKDGSLKATAFGMGL